MEVRRCRLGHGLFAVHNIYAGQVILTYEGECISHIEADIREADRDRRGMAGDYMLDAGAYTIDATNVFNGSRFANHSCSPNADFCFYELSNGEMLPYIRALTAIRAGCEITVDYGMIIRQEQRCLCNSGNCTGWMN